jgi:hypothetical protein
LVVWHRPQRTYGITNLVSGGLHVVATGTWKRTQVTCDGVEHCEDPVDITLAPGDGAACAFSNTFVPGGAISILKETIGDTARVGFVIERVGDPNVEYRQVADVRRTNVPTRATGADTSHIPLGTYRITEQRRPRANSRTPPARPPTWRSPRR